MDKKEIEKAAKENCAFEEDRKIWIEGAEWALSQPKKDVYSDSSEIFKQMWHDGKIEILGDNNVTELSKLFTKKEVELDEAIYNNTRLIIHDGLTNFCNDKDCSNLNRKDFLNFSNIISKSILSRLQKPLVCVSKHTESDIVKDAEKQLNIDILKDNDELNHIW